MKRTLRIFLLSIFIFAETFSSFASFGIASKSSNETSVNPNEVTTIPSVDAAKSAMKEFKELSRRERRDRVKEMKNVLKELKAEKKAGEDINTNTLLLVLLSILVPPLAVYLHEGETNTKFWVNVLLTLLGYLIFGFAGIFFLGSLPGIIHALIVVLS